MLSSPAFGLRDYSAPNLIWAERALLAFKHQAPIAEYLDSYQTDSQSTGVIKFASAKLLILALYPLYILIKWTLPFWIRKVESAVVETRGYLEYVPLFTIEHAKRELNSIHRMSKLLLNLSSENWLALLNDESLPANVRHLFANCFEMRTNIQEAIRLLNLVILQGSPDLLDATLSDADADTMHSIFQKRLAVLHQTMEPSDEDREWMEADLTPVID
jgi:hypothetical protein